jgi:cation transport ATPase
MSTLVALGTGAAFLYSLAVTVTSGGAVYYEAVRRRSSPSSSSGGGWRAGRGGRTSEAIDRLARLQVDRARLVMDGAEREVPLADVRPGDVLAVRPGESIPSDGVVLSGTSRWTPPCSREKAFPSPRDRGTRSWEPSINRTGAFTFRVTRVGADTMLGQIVRWCGRRRESARPFNAWRTA